MRMRGVMSLIAGVAVLLPATAGAQACAALVSEYTGWLTRTTLPNGSLEALPAGTRKAVAFTIVSNQRNDQPESSIPTRRNNLDALRSTNTVAYGIGSMRALSTASGIHLEGVGQFLFSDRAADPGLAVHQFFSGDTDVIRLNVEPSGTVTITLVRWGNAVLRFSAQCQNGVMYGFAPGIGGNASPALYVVSFFKQLIPQ